MKKNLKSHTVYGFLPRFNPLQLSGILPHIFIVAVLVLLACTIHVPGQQRSLNFVPRNDRPTSGSMGEAMRVSMEQRVFDLVNSERVRHGLKPLVWVDRIAAVARYHSDNMATQNFFAHEDPSGRKAGKRADKLGADWNQISENIAWLSGSDPAGRVVQAWMKSPGHRRNILDSSPKESGDRSRRLIRRQIFLYAGFHSPVVTPSPWL
jgi:hypothetical protein